MPRRGACADERPSLMHTGWQRPQPRAPVALAGMVSAAVVGLGAAGAVDRAVSRGEVRPEPPRWSRDEAGAVARARPALVVMPPRPGVPRHRPGAADLDAVAAAAVRDP